MQSVAEELTGGQRAALHLHLHTPTILPGQGGHFLPATACRLLAFPHPAEGEVQLTQKEKKAKNCTILRGGKRENTDRAKLQLASTS